MSRIGQRLTVAGLLVALAFTGHAVWARGGFGGGGGGGRGGGGGGFGGGGGNFGGGGGNFGGGGGGARPSPNISRSPSFSSPSASRPAPRPSTPNVSRPSTPNVSRPSNPGTSRPSLPSGGNRPSVGGPGSGTNRPGTVDFNRPSTLPGNRPGLADNRPGANVQPGNRPGIGDNRPGVGPGAGNNRPGVGPGGGNNRPGVGPGIGNNRPGVGPGTRPNLPGVGNNQPGIANRPGLGDRPATLPGLSNRPGLGDNRPGTGNRPNWNDRPISGNINDLHVNNINNINNNFNNFHNVGNTRPAGGWNQNHQDWHDWHQDWHHNSWCHGYWPGHGGSYWNYMWNNYPVAAAFGVTSWGINTMSYLFGYAPYYNPYYVTPAVAAPVYIDYSQPLVVNQPITQDALQTADSGSQPLPPGVGQASVSTFDQARQAFLDGNYQQAQDLTEQALKDAPRDAAMHEFRALTLFAQGDYQNAAATLHAVLAVGPGWDWTTLIGLYPSEDVYTEQLRKLESFVKAKPKQTDGHFVLAYHYLTCGHTDAAVRQLKVVQEQQPKDTLAPQLLQMLTGEAAGAPATATPPPVGDTDKAAPEIPVKVLLGTWTAQGTGNTKFSLELGENNEFTWTYQQGAKKDSVKGVFGLDGDTLAMQPDSGGTMLAQVTEPKNGQFHFQMVGSPAGDPGLNFKQ